MILGCANENVPVESIKEPIDEFDIATVEDHDEAINELTELHDLVKKLDEESKKYAATDFQYVFNLNIQYISVRFDSLPEFGRDSKNLMGLISLVAKTPADRILIDFYRDKELFIQYTVDRTVAEEFVEKSISEEELIEKIAILKVHELFK